MAARHGDQRALSKASRLRIIFTAAVIGLSGASLAKAEGPYLDFQGNVLDPNNNAAFTPAPFLYDGNVAAVQAYLTQQQASGGILAIRINQPISQATAQAIFNNYPINYVFADLEGGTNVSQMQQLAGWLQTSTKSAGAYVGNFAFGTISGDPTLTTSIGTSVPLSTYQSSGANMSNPSLYPGSPDFRGPWNTGATGQTITGGSFPNIRSALFILPIERLSYNVQNAGGAPVIPYVSRFNGYLNANLNNSTANGGPAFTPGIALNGPSANTSISTTNQMLSRDDFMAQMLHYRLRGATGFHLFQAGVVGYTDAEFQSDALTGFQYLDNNPYAYASGTVSTSPVTLGSTLNVNGGRESAEDAGIIVSGITNSNSKMALFISNMTDSAANVGLPSTLGNVPTPAGELLAVGADSHDLFEFSEVSGIWHLDQSMVIFNDPTLDSQNDVGVPEPAAVSMLAIGAIGLLAGRDGRKRASRRRRLM